MPLLRPSVSLALPSIIVLVLTGDVTWQVLEAGLQLVSANGPTTFYRQVGTQTVAGNTATFTGTLAISPDGYQYDQGFAQGDHKDVVAVSYHQSCTYGTNGQGAG